MKRIIGEKIDQTLIVVLTPASVVGDRFDDPIGLVSLWLDGRGR